MRLSLRTLLAFEDGVFDVDQHRRLEHLFTGNRHAEALLYRIRYVVRNPMLGVPGLVNQQEELDPNYVAEYLDHQMSNETQHKFEDYCLSTDKYLAEIASIHNVLTNTLGEPAQATRDCRLKCYNVQPPAAQSGLAHPNASHPATSPIPPAAPASPFFRPDESPSPPNPGSFWRRWFPKKTTPPNPPPSSPMKSIWNFLLIGMCLCTILYGWQLIETKRTASLLQSNTSLFDEHRSSEQHPDTLSSHALHHELHSDHAYSRNAHSDHIHSAGLHSSDWSIAPDHPAVHLSQPATAHSTQTPFSRNGHEQSMEPTDASDSFLTDHPQEFAALPEPVLPTAHAPTALPPIANQSPTNQSLTNQSLTNRPPTNRANTNPMAGRQTDHFEEDAFADAASLAVEHADFDFAYSQTEPSNASQSHSNQPLPAHTEVLPINHSLSRVQSEFHNEDDSILAFQPITTSVRAAIIPPNPIVQTSGTMPSASSTSRDTPYLETPSISVSQPSQSSQPSQPSQPQEVSQTMQPEPPHEPVAVGQVVATPFPNVIFSAPSSKHDWELPETPFNLYAQQYLLTAAPFRGTLNIADRFRIEMIGDAKLCILPPDSSGIPGIFVDYGRIIIHPLRSGQSLRIATENSCGTITVSGTTSTLFIDTFAEVSNPNARTNILLQQDITRPRISPILGFIPRNGEHIVWHAEKQTQPFPVTSQGSVMLYSDRYQFGQIQTLPNWLGNLPMTQDDRRLAELCRQFFAEGEGEQALNRLTQHAAPTVRLLGLRLWGDLGNFVEPLDAMRQRNPEDEAVRTVLGQYFEEVMRRDSETIQRFADAINVIRQR